MNEDRARVIALRQEYATTYAEHIARIVAAAPPLTPGQLAHLRRVFRTRQRHDAAA